jgi:hypothetical protein
MHWPNYDRTTWGLIIAVAALVLAVPLSVIGNLITPYLRDWWSRRSAASLKERIATKEKELHRISALPEMTEHEELVTLGLFSVIAIASTLGFLALWTGFYFGVALIKIRIPFELNTWTIGAVGMSFGIQLYLFQFQAHYQKQIRDKSPMRRRSLENSIAALKTRFEKMTKPYDVRIKLSN